MQNRSLDPHESPHHHGQLQLQQQKLTGNHDKLRQRDVVRFHCQDAKVPFLSKLVLKDPSIAPARGPQESVGNG